MPSSKARIYAANAAVLAAFGAYGRDHRSNGLFQMSNLTLKGKIWKCGDRDSVYSVFLRCTRC